MMLVSRIRRSTPPNHPLLGYTSSDAPCPLAPRLEHDRLFVHGGCATAPPQEFNLPALSGSAFLLTKFGLTRSMGTIGARRTGHKARGIGAGPSTNDGDPSSHRTALTGHRQMIRGGRG